MEHSLNFGRSADMPRLKSRPKKARLGRYLADDLATWKLRLHAGCACRNFYLFCFSFSKHADLRRHCRLHVSLPRLLIPSMVLRILPT